MGGFGPLYFQVRDVSVLMGDAPDFRMLLKRGNPRPSSTKSRSDTKRKRRPLPHHPVSAPQGDQGSSTGFPIRTATLSAGLAPGSARAPDARCARAADRENPHEGSTIGAGSALGSGDRRTGPLPRGLPHSCGAGPVPTAGAKGRAEPGKARCRFHGGLSSGPEATRELPGRNAGGPVVGTAKQGPVRSCSTGFGPCRRAGGLRRSPIGRRPGRPGCMR